jgi:hypothetical protein
MQSDKQMRVPEVLNRKIPKYQDPESMRGLVNCDELYLLRGFAAYSRRLASGTFVGLWINPNVGCEIPSLQGTALHERDEMLHKF